MEQAGKSPEFAHELAVAHLLDTVGAGSIAEELRPVILGFVDQMSIYLDCMPYADFRVGPVSIRVGEQKSFLLAKISDRRSPLRLREATSRWTFFTQTGRIDEMVGRVNARRKGFLNLYTHRVLRPLCKGLAERLTEYSMQRPGARVNFNMSRFMEDVSATIFCIDFDDRAAPLKTDTYTQPYRLQ